jgi:hypothetical protein
MNNIRTGHKTIYLILALACFVGIIIIFVFDGYMGLYDTLTMVAGEQTTTIEPQQWMDSAKFGYPPGLYSPNTGELSFSYKVDNRRFTTYNQELQISIHKNQQKIADVLSKELKVNAFGKETVTWTINTNDILTANTITDSQFTLVINNGKLERDVIISVQPNMKTIPITPSAP